MQVSRLKDVAAILVTASLAALLIAGCAPGPGDSSAQPPSPPSQPETHPAPVGSSLVKENGIAIREFALAERPDNIEAFNRLPSDVWEDLNDTTHGIVDRWGHRRPSLADLNDALQTWGFSLRPVSDASTASQPDRYQVLKGGQVINELALTTALGRSQDGRRAVFVAEDTKGSPLLFLEGEFKAWDVAGAADYVPPVFVGNSLYSLTRTGDNAGEPLTYSIVRDGEARPVYTFKAMFYTDSPIHGFYSTEGGWVLEYSEHVVVNGEDLGAAAGYAKVFHHRQLAGKPFYFFDKGGRVGMSYGGKTLTPQYDEVLHYQCCEPAIANPRTSEIAVRFFAQREGKWYYVSALVPAD
ncbi:MAG: hypothetical protein ACYC5Y_02875 [Symbiobacteriia bacterium]